jgi:peptide/nickel transport system permease protein
LARYVARRLLLFIPTLWGLLTFVFILNRAMPGDPVDLMLGEGAPVEKREDLRKALGLDRPLLVQYAGYFGELASLNLGRSIRTQRPVTEELRAAFPLTLELGLSALVFAALVAFPLGLLSARKPGGAWDRFSRFYTSAGLSLPSFFVGPLLLLALAIELPWFPVSGADEPGSLVLPAVTLALPLSALVARILRASLLEESGKEYLRTARIKGLSEGEVLRRHALRNALLPVSTVLGLQFGALLTGAILTEKIFRWPGLGTLVLTAITSRDYPVVQGAVLLFALVTLAATLATDLCYGLIDPRVRYE